MARRRIPGFHALKFGLLCAALGASSVGCDGDSSNATPDDCEGSDCPMAEPAAEAESDDMRRRRSPSSRDIERNAEDNNADASVEIGDGGPMDAAVAREPDAAVQPGEAACGDGTVDDGEACDDGEANVDTATTPGGGCNTQCEVVPECISDAQCGGVVPYCAAGTCTQCRENVHCVNAAESVCTGGQCVACRAGMHEDCSHIPGKNQCLKGERCAECSPIGEPASEEDTCGTGVCNALTGSCSFYQVGTSDLCGLRPSSPTIPPGECIATAQCKAPYLCAPLEFDGELVGHYCQPPAVGGLCNTSYQLEGVSWPEFTHFARRVTAKTIEGQERQICTLNATTCHGLVYERAGKSCMRDSECGASGFDDALCENDECRPRCIDNADCVSSSGCLSPDPDRLICATPA